VGLENSQTREERLKTIAWWQAAQSLLDPGSTESIVGTPWDWDDLYAWLLVQKTKHGMPLGVYQRSCWMPCEPETAGAAEVTGFGWVRPTFPERFPVPELVRIKKEIGSTRFAAQYLLDPVDEETAVFPRSKAVIWPASKRASLDLDHLWVVATVDPAISQKGWADYTAHAVVGFDHENTMYVLHLNRGRWPESTVLAEVYRVHAQYPMTRAIGIEAIGFQKMFFHLFAREAEKRGRFLPVVKLERDTKITKNTRIRVLEPLWNAQQIIFFDDLPVLEDFLDEAARFRLTKESTHDDMLDALADCFQLRVQPPAVDPHPERRALPPEDAERLEFEERLVQTRQDAKMPPLDTGSLRMAWAMRQDVEERARQTHVVSAYEETWQ
jgi:predicted phage terminase large subunit-like protein